MLLESGFHLGQKNRIYRYLHHSQSQLKDKQFWFYHHDGKTNFSFEEAFAWMGDFQDEKIVAKHAARIAQCFTSAEATIQVKEKRVFFSFIVTFHRCFFLLFRFLQTTSNMLKIFKRRTPNTISPMVLEQCQRKYGIE